MLKFTLNSRSNDTPLVISMLMTTILAVASATALAANEQTVRTAPDIHPSATRQSDYLKEPYDLESLIASLPIQYQQEKFTTPSRVRPCQLKECLPRNGGQ